MSIFKRWMHKHQWKLLVDLEAFTYRDGCEGSAFEKCETCGKYGRVIWKLPIYIRVAPSPQEVADQYARRFAVEAAKEGP